MIVRSMRWGYDGGGIACGPVDGNTIVEIVVTHEKHNYFVCASSMDGFMKITLSPVSVYDLLMEANHPEVDWKSEYEKAENLVTEDYDFETFDLDECINDIEAMRRSEFADVYKLICLAMDEACMTDEPSYEEAVEFIEKHVGEELSKFQLPDFKEIYGNEMDEGC